MKIFVKAKAGTKAEKVEAPPQKLWEEKGGDKEPRWYTVHVKEPPVQGRANEAITRALAEHFGVAKSQVTLISGASSKKKVFEIK